MTDEAIAQHVYRLLVEELNFCCGFPEDSVRPVRELLEAVDVDHAEKSSARVDAFTSDRAVTALLLYRFAAVGLTEHGSIITASWLTKRGRWYMHALDRVDWDDVEEAGAPHDGGACTEACLKPFWIREQMYRATP